jgi:hypothetical protein
MPDMPDRPDTLPIRCPYCGTPHKAALEGWTAGGPLQANTWTCQYCHKANMMSLPAKVTAVEQTGWRPDWLVQSDLKPADD